MASDVVVVLFNRDLRVHDHPALHEAARGATGVVPLFVLDPALLGSRLPSANRVAFLLEALQDLRGSLQRKGAGLLVRRGDTVQETMTVASEVGATRLHASADVTPLGRRRESELARECGRRRMHFETFPGVTVVPAGELTPAGADHFRVFTPYWNHWRSTPLRPVLAAPARLPGLISKDGAIPPGSSITSGSESPGREPGGETAGRARARRWLSRGNGGAPGGAELSPDGSSRLSAYLHFGCVSPNELCHQAGARGNEELLRQLCWRDFHHQVVAAFPRMGRDDYRPGRRTWRSDVEALSAWKEGDTGVPVVDAGMRQLLAEGWMPNRARMLAAYYLTRCLGVDWRRGAEHFMGWLTDADVANNYGNWQWVAGTGNDTRPNRSFNLARQAQRHDPGGEYIRRWLPQGRGT